MAKTPPTTWAELTTEQQESAENYWATNAMGKRIAADATTNGVLDRDYALWLSLANILCMRRAGVSVLDLADFAWRDHHESGVTPLEALNTALVAEGLML